MTPQSQLVFGVISRLDLPVTKEEKQQLLAQQSSNEQVLKMFLEAEGGAGLPPAAGTHDGERRSSLPHWLAQLPWRGVGVVLADDTDVRGAILDSLERYRRASEARDVQALSAIYSDFPAEQQAAQQRYFDNVRDLRITIDNPDIVVIGDQGVLSFTRRDDFVDVRTGKPMHVTVRLTKVLRHAGGEWRMAAR